MSLVGWFTGKQSRGRFATHEALFMGLSRMEDGAILALQKKALPMVRKLVTDKGLGKEQVEDLLNRGTMIFLEKIDAGAYHFQGYAPTTYLLEIVKRLTADALKKTRRAFERRGELTEEIADEDHLLREDRQESAELVNSLLTHLGDPCARVVTLHHISGYTDDEVVRRRMTTYSTKASLKVKRSACMQQLIKIARQWKMVNSI